MRLLSSLCCAFALVLSLAPGVRADEYNKQTFLTFSGPVQLPGVTLPAGTYMLKLADPDSGRRAIQVWDKEGMKLYTTLLTIPNQRMEPPDEPVVMFQERAAGEPQAIKAWFYPGESYGMEFIYPKNQAMKIAKATHEPVLSVSNETKSDVASMKTAKVEKVDENGNVIDENKTASNESKANQRAASSAATTTTAQNATTSTTSASKRDESRRAPVGTSGASQSAAPQTSTTASQQNASQQNRSAEQSAGTAGRTLPRTASGLELMELFSALSLAGAVATRRLRARFARA
jgi:hypothetical protein